MRKAHLFEALYLVNQATDEAARGLERLKKVPGFTGEIYGDTLAKLEHARAQINLRFFADRQASEQQDAAHYQRPERSAREEKQLNGEPKPPQP